MPSERRDITALIGAVRRRLVFDTGAVALAAGAAGAASLRLLEILTGWPGTPVLRFVLAGLLVATMLRVLRRRTTRAAAARAIEHACQACRNLVITAEECEREPARWPAAVRGRVLETATRTTAGVRARAVVPLRNSLAALVVFAGLTAAAAPAAERPLLQLLPAGVVVPASAAAAPVVHVTIEPPAYSGLAASTLTDPPRIDALEGSRVRFELPDGWQLRSGDGEAITDVTVSASGFFVVEDAADASTRRLIPLAVTQDASPSVRIDAPARDLLVADGERSLPLEIAASDDLGLASLEVRYTHVSGSGEQYEFAEGTVPVEPIIESPRQWQGRTSLRLTSLDLRPGDSIVYRAVARDRRDGDTGLATSDTYIVEIAGPGQIALDGIDMPPGPERYALSQQMIVLKLERLRLRQARLTREALRDETASLAAEQRSVRANFIFLLGGHVEDEEEEAAQSHEIQEGRLENTARQEIGRAIGLMTRTEQGLAAVDPAAALPPARAAVEALQRAFARHRYLLRALSTRSQLDLSRRLTGASSDASGWRRTIAETDDDVAAAQRRMLADLLQVAEGTGASGVVDQRRARDLAEAALRIDPASPVWRQVAGDLLAARDQDELQPIIARVAAEVQKNGLPRTPLTDRRSAVSRAFRERQR